MKKYLLILSTLCIVGGCATAALASDGPARPSMQQIVNTFLDLAGAKPMNADINMGGHNIIHSPGYTNMSSFAAKAVPKGSLMPNVMDYGAKGDGVTDDGPAIQAAFNASTGKTVYIPGGRTFCTYSGLVQPVGVKLKIDPSATIKALAPMAAVISTPLTSPHVDGEITGGIIDCNGYAQAGVHICWAQHFLYEDSKIQNFLKSSVIVGSSAASGSSYEVTLRHIHGINPSGMTAPTGSIGLDFDNTSDDVVDDCVFVGAKTGVRANTYDTMFSKVHCWNYATNGAMDKCFDVVGGDNFFSQCVADTPGTYGFDIENYNNSLQGCNIYNGPWGGVNNVITGVNIGAGGAHSSVIGCMFAGTPTTMILNDILGIGTVPGISVDGNQASNVTNTYGTLASVSTAPPFDQLASLTVPGGVTYISAGTTPIIGSELEIDPHFATPGDWNYASAPGWSISGGMATVSHSGAAGAVGNSPSLITVPGQTYQITITISALANSTGVYVLAWSASGTKSLTYHYSTGTFTETLVSDRAYYLSMQPVGSNPSASISYFSVKPVSYSATSLVQDLALTYDPAGHVLSAPYVSTGTGANVASASTITPTGQIFHVTGTTTVNTINLPTAFWHGKITIIPDGVFSTGTSGNIANVVTSAVNTPLDAVYDNGTGKWYIK